MIANLYKLKHALNWVIHYVHMLCMGDFNAYCMQSHNILSLSIWMGAAAGIHDSPPSVVITVV